MGARAESDHFDVTVIRSWLGHASLDTINIYARANVETKRRALEEGRWFGSARKTAPLETRSRTAELARFALTAPNGGGANNQQVDAAEYLLRTGTGPFPSHYQILIINLYQSAGSQSSRLSVARYETEALDA